MATDARSTVTIDVAVNTAKAAPELDKVTASLKEIEAAQQQVNQTANAMAADVPRSYAELRAAAPGNIWNLPVRGQTEIVPDVAPAAQEAATQTRGIFSDLGDDLRKIADGVKRGWNALFDWIAAGAKKLGSFLSTAFQGPLGFATGFVVSSGVDFVMKGFQEVVDKVAKLEPKAREIGATVQELQRLTLWAKMGDVSENRALRTVEDLTKTIGGVTTGAKGYKKAAEGFADLGIELQIGDHIKTAIELLPELATKLSALEDPTRRAADAAAVLGLGWREMLPLFMKGPEAIDAAIEASKKAGEISPEMEKAAKAYSDALPLFQNALESLRMELGAALLPAITEALTGLTKWVEENREGIVGGFQAMVTVVSALATGLRTIGQVLDDLNRGNYGRVLADISPKDDDVQRWKTWGEAIRDTVGQMPLDPMTAPIKLAIPIVDALAAAWKHVAEAIDAATGAWERWKGLPTTALVPPTGEANVWAPPAAPPASTAPGPVVSTGGGPIAFEDLAGARGGGIVGKPPSGTVNVVIENKNPQPGQKVSATAAGDGVKTQVDTGVSMPWSAPTYQGPYAPAGA